MFFRVISLWVRWKRSAGVGLAVFALSASPSLGQAQWQQTIQVIAPVEEETVTRALLTSAISVSENQDTPVQSAPDKEPTSLSNLRNGLSEEGLALSSATHVFVTYRFSLSSSTLAQEILDLQFIYRPAGQEEDIPVLYLDLDDARLHKALLVEQGTRLTQNEAAFVPFDRQLSFHNVRDRATVVKVGNQIVRDSARAAAEKERILEITQELTYN